MTDSGSNLKANNFESGKKYGKAASSSSSAESQHMCVKRECVKNIAAIAGAAPKKLFFCVMPKSSVWRTWISGADDDGNLWDSRIIIYFLFLSDSSGKC